MAMPLQAPTGVCMPPPIIVYNLFVHFTANFKNKTEIAKIFYFVRSNIVYGTSSFQAASFTALTVARFYERFYHGAPGT